MSVAAPLLGVELGLLDDLRTNDKGEVLHCF